MFGFKKENGAQLYDRFLMRTALSLLMLTLVYALDALRGFAADDIAALMARAEGILGILIVLNLLPVTIKLLWFRAKGKPGCNDPDGFMASTFNAAAVRAFAIGFVSMLVALELSRSVLSDWPATVFLNIVLALMLGVLSVSFLLASRETEADDDFEDDDFESASE